MGDAGQVPEAGRARIRGEPPCPAPRALEFEQAMKKANVSQAEMARRINTSRAAIRRLLDANDPSITLATISRAAPALGRSTRLKFDA